MLRKIRIVAAVLFFLLITLLFLDFTGTLHAWFGWMAKIQFLPALLALNVGVVAFLVILTLLFGPVNGNAGSDNNDPPDNRHHDIERVVHEIELQRMPNPKEGNGSQQKHSGYDPVALSHTT